MGSLGVGLGGWPLGSALGVGGGQAGWIGLGVSLVSSQGGDFGVE